MYFEDTISEDSMEDVIEQRCGADAWMSLGYPLFI